MLYIVGNNITGANASRRAANGQIIRLVQGLYCDPDDLKDPDEFVRQNALRIAAHVAPSSALSQVSAFIRGAVPTTLPPPAGDAAQAVPETPATPTEGYRLFMSGAYSFTKKIDIPGQSKPGFLQIVHSDDMRDMKSTSTVFAQARIPDGFESELGELSMLCASDELVFLQQFGRRRGHLERFMSDERLSRLYQNLVDLYGGRLRDILQTIAASTECFAEELKRAEAYIQLKQQGEPEMRKLMYDYKVGWNGRHVANLQHDGMGWHFDFNEGWVLPLSFQDRRPGAIPSFVTNLFPEGWMREQVESGLGPDVHILQASERYLSNIAIVADGERIAALPEDILVGRLGDFSRDDVFQGEILGLPPIDESFIDHLGMMVRNKAMPRMSGTQMKIPMHLDDKGQIYPCTEKGFTHILKLPGHTNDRHGARGAVEWACMRMSGAGGVVTCNFALADMGELQPAYIAERFDIRTNEEDFRLIFAEDLCSVSGLNPFAKFTGTMEDPASKVVKYSTQPAEDARQLLRMNVVSWLLENGDFHLKNLSLVKVAAPQLDRFRSVRLSPAYDIMSTKFFKDFASPPQDFETLALSVNGKQSGFTTDDFVAFGAAIGIPEGEAARMVLDTCRGVVKEATRILTSMPECITRFEPINEIVTKVCQRAIYQVSQLEPDALKDNDNLPKPKPAGADAHRIPGLTASR